MCGAHFREDCLVFEDAPSGVSSAKQAGAFVVAVPEAFAEGDEEAEAVFRTADRRLSSLEALQDRGRGAS